MPYHWEINYTSDEGIIFINVWVTHDDDNYTRYEAAIWPLGIAAYTGDSEVYGTKPMLPPPSAEAIAKEVQAHLKAQ